MTTELSHVLYQNLLQLQGLGPLWPLLHHIRYGENMLGQGPYMLGHRAYLARVEAAATVLLHDVQAALAAAEQEEAEQGQLDTEREKRRRRRERKRKNKWVWAWLQRLPKSPLPAMNLEREEGPGEMQSTK